MNKINVEINSTRLTRDSSFTRKLPHLRPNGHVLKTETTNKNHWNQTTKAKQPKGAKRNELKSTKQLEKPLSLLRANRKQVRLTGMLCIQANRSIGLKVHTESPCKITLSNIINDNGFSCFVDFLSFTLFRRFRFVFTTCNNDILLQRYLTLNVTTKSIKQTNLWILEVLWTEI